MGRLGNNGAMTQQYLYPVVFEADEDGGFAVMCPAIPGCISQGDTVEEATENIRDAIMLCLADMRERGESIPLPTQVTTGTVAVAV